MHLNYEYIREDFARSGEWSNNLQVSVLLSGGPGGPRIHGSPRPPTLTKPLVFRTRPLRKRFYLCSTDFVRDF